MHCRNGARAKPALGESSNSRNPLSTGLDKPDSMRYHPASEFPDMVARIARVSLTTPCFRCGLPSLHPLLTRLIRL